MFTDSYARKTGLAFISSRILKTPFWAIYTMLPIILYKDLQATPFQIAFMIGLKPTVSIFSIYWSSLVSERPDRLKNNLVWASVLSLLPFFFFPWIQNVWLYILAFGFHMMLHRGVIPAWMEIFKRNIPEGSRGKLFAYSTALGYAGDAILPLMIGSIMDTHNQAWRWIFPATAFISLLPVWLQYRIPIDTISTEVPASSLSLTKPWKEAFMLLKRRPDFLQFQIGFMLAGGGLMVAHAALPMFFVDSLNLSYKELAIALTLCKGIGFAITTPLWTASIDRQNAFRFSSLVFACAAVFPILVLTGRLHISSLFLGYFCYGIMQAGSQLSWNLSGPIFAGSEDSSCYSSINILTVGIRGCICPFIGAALCGLSGAGAVMVMSSLLCLCGAWYANKHPISQSNMQLN